MPPLPPPLRVPYDPRHDAAAALSSRWRTGTPRSTQARRATDAVNFYAGGHLNRASWLRESAAYLNKALVRPDTRFVLLNQGNPLVRRNDASHRIALFQWKDVERTVLDTVRRIAPGATRVFGPEAYALQKRADADEKHWTRSTQSLLAPSLSLAYLGILEDTNTAPSTESFEDTNARALVVPSGAPYFALSLSYRPPGTPEDARLPGAELLRTLTDEQTGAYEELHMRTVVLTGALDRDDGAIVANARALLDWNEQYAFCAGCGSRQYSVWGGHKRACASVLARVAERAPLVEAVHPAPPPGTVCASALSLQNYSYPRSDPVIIVGIVSADQEHVLLGRQSAWPKGMYSCIAYVSSPTHPSGFVEPGESLEDAVRREALEETGVRIEQVAYHSSQPWPFPANLIFGAFGLAKKTSADIRLDLDAELEDAFFAPRADVLAAVAAAEQGQRPQGNDAPTRNGQNYLYVQLLMQRAAAIGHRPRPPRRLGPRPGTRAGENVGEG